MAKKKNTKAEQVAEGLVQATRGVRGASESVATLVSSADVAAMQEELRIYRKTDASLRAEIVQRNGRIGELKRQLEASEADAVEAIKTSHEIADRLRKEFAEERKRAQGWQATAGELREENTRLKAAQEEHKTLLAERCKEAQLLAAERNDAVQAVFSWRLACFLLVSLSASLIAIMFWAR